jgi:plastocyanin
MAAGGLVLGLAALAIASLEGPSAGAQSTPGDEDYEVWITELGFNPASCVVRRSDNVRFVNKTNAVRNVIFDDLRPPNDPNTPLSTGDLAPGATSGYYSFDFAGSNEYHEQYNPAWTGAISTTNSGVASCTYLPPTPTPTATPTVSPTPTASPTPPRSPACALPADCVVTGGVSRDE